mmetsp:Transcript_21665/g.34384  ORF Transcript_21665/g.34384 Transcript_21665/m.34384 type:complete len:282 (+) Transcript_21665:2006-2851(+)
MHQRQRDAGDVAGVIDAGVHFALGLQPQDLHHADQPRVLPHLVRGEHLPDVHPLLEHSGDLQFRQSTLLGHHGLQVPISITHKNHVSHFIAVQKVMPLQPHHQLLQCLNKSWGSIDLLLSDPCELRAELGERGMHLRAHKRTELINDLPRCRVQQDHRQLNDLLRHKARPLIARGLQVHYSIIPERLGLGRRLRMQDWVCTLRKDVLFEVPRHIPIDFFTPQWQIAQRDVMQGLEPRRIRGDGARQKARDSEDAILGHAGDDQGCSPSGQNLPKLGPDPFP